MRNQTCNIFPKEHTHNKFSCGYSALKQNVTLNSSATFVLFTFFIVIRTSYQRFATSMMRVKATKSITSEDKIGRLWFYLNLSLHYRMKSRTATFPFFDRSYSGINISAYKVLFTWPKYKLKYHRRLPIYSQIYSGLRSAIFTEHTSAPHFPLPA